MNLFSNPKNDNIPRHKLLRRQTRDQLVVSRNGGVRRLDLLQGLERLLRVALLPNPDDGVHHQNQEDGARGGEVQVRGRGRGAQEEGDEGGDEEDADKGVVELIKDVLEHRGAGVLLELVPAVDFPTTGDVSGVEATVGGDIKHGLAFKDGSGPGWKDPRSWPPLPI
ncbi:uncharacterized protein A4U43_UnF7640 [Asparagus officinalis]|uniref:Uncharacterized protein n=1 Tax=Asparagus officinalis TaxID=4686 RepID=A0A1R3L659_ASPOF|nr:uncharacterized protein A4U43_UnF7640 [Asparagus officinalis]